MSHYTHQTNRDFQVKLLILVIYLTLIAQFGFAREGVIARCGTSKGTSYFLKDEIWNPDGEWLKDGVSQGEIVLVKMDDKWDIQFADARRVPPLYSYRDDGAEVIPLGGSTDKIFRVGAFHANYADVYTFNFTGNEVLWTSHKTVLSPKVGIYRAECISTTSQHKSNNTTPGTTDQGDINLVNKAIIFVEGFNQIWSNNNSVALDILPKLYAPNVDFYGSNWPRQKVMAEKEEFALRWPERSYTFRADRQASYCNEAGSCVVKGKIDWYAHSPTRGRTSRGTAKATIGLQQIGDQLSIVHEDGKVLKRN